jgi:hypothetical protein
MQLTVAGIKARIARLDRLARGLAKEVALQRGTEDVLLFREPGSTCEPFRRRWPGRRRPGWHRSGR